MAKFKKLGGEMALVVIQFKGKCQNCSEVGCEIALYKSKQMREEELICNNFKNAGHLKSNCFNSMIKMRVEENGNDMYQNSAT
jgi:hypothetical protein